MVGQGQKLIALTKAVSSHKRVGSMIQTIAKLLSAAPTKQIDALSRQVADLSMEGVCQLVSGPIQSMTFSEARGYVRARAGRIVQKKALQVLNQHSATQTRATQNRATESAWVDDVVHAATEQLVPLVLRQVGLGVPKAATKLRLAKLRLAA